MTQSTTKKNENSIGLEIDKIILMKICYSMASGRQDFTLEIENIEKEEGK